MAVTLTGDQIARAAEALQHIPDGAVKAMARAINRAIEGARTAAGKAIRQHYRVTARDIRATMTLRRASPARLEATVTSVGRKLPLFAFAPRPSKPGTGGKGRPYLTVGVHKGRRTKHGKAWIGTFGSRLQVAMRTGKKRQPVRVLKGPAIPQMLGVPDVIAEVERVATERLDRRIDHEIRVLLERLDRRL